MIQYTELVVECQIGGIDTMFSVIFRRPLTQAEFEDIGPKVAINTKDWRPFKVFDVKLKELEPPWPHVDKTD